MALPGRPRTVGGTETRFRARGQDGTGSTRFRGPTPTEPRFFETPRVFVPQLGSTPGLQDIDIARTAGRGTIRRLYLQAVNYLSPGDGLSWTENRVAADGVVTRSPITRALRYKASSLFRGAGSMSTRFGAERAFIPSRHNTPRPTLNAGNLQGRPVLRNRLQSFGSRVPPVNARGAS